MNSFGNLIRMVSSLVAEVKRLGGVTQTRYISPKGLYAKPKGENAVIIDMNGGNSQDVLLALQKEVDLKDGEVILTDDKSYIKFTFQDGGIEVSTKKLTIRALVEIFGGSVKHNGKDIGESHAHPQNDGNHFGGGVSTGGVNG